MQASKHIKLTRMKKMKKIKILGINLKIKFFDFPICITFQTLAFS
jgi:hypothetical protein